VAATKWTALVAGQAGSGDGQSPREPARPSHEAETAGGLVVDNEVPVIAVRGITKHFGSIQALRGVDLEVRRGEVVGLVGDNGAGKSTLVNILSGALQPNTGSIFVDGKAVSFGSSLEARRLGIETVYQDLSLAPDLSVWANIFLGREQTVKGPLRVFGWLDRRAMARSAEVDLERTRIRIGSVSSLAGRLSGGQRQAIAVGRAVAWGSKVILMDEPTAALGVEQQGRVGELVRSVCDNGVPVLFISHNLPQVHKICDRVVVLFQGRVVANLRPAESSVDDIVAWITGAAMGGTRSGL
jgi:ABC-type sugar transport system ATPase subunit